PRRRRQPARAAVRLLPGASRRAGAALLALPARPPGLVRRGVLGVAGPPARLGVTRRGPSASVELRVVESGRSREAARRRLGRAPGGLPSIWAVAAPAGIVSPRVSGRSCVSAAPPTQTDKHTDRGLPRGE